MPNNQKKEEVKCEECHGEKLIALEMGGVIPCHFCDPKPESIVTTLEEDRKLLKQYSAVTSDLLAGMLICNRDWQAWELGTMTEDDFFDASDDDDSVGQIDAFIEKLLAAKERVVKAECAAEFDPFIESGMNADFFKEMKSKILNNPSL